MNSASIIVAVLVVLFIVFAFYGSYKTLHTDKNDCCCSSKGTCETGDVSTHCSVRKQI